ncbi:FAD-dependent monooxygenase [Paeniglutamicibacter gangotriensis]|uniref:FAD-binding monooxygenase n=1 Tax=Paeniglutamicibacter gangotriensis Lz1y TaxID=1276920 RepID=M7NDZ6_9MICC|nr:FAD-dependent monooxygenase [Paeniglutamicibacter gangotriensis]EMQ96718.1 FAD-binding monooxygenase [Paeniglutamicibacter gangotriensis Lz1y]
MSNSHDAIVVGAGPVGMTAALALHSVGVQATVLEAEPFDRQRPGSRAIFTHSESLRILDRIRPGLGFALSEYGIYWATQRTFFGGKEVYTTTYPAPKPGTYPHFTSLPQVHIERFLFEACQEAGVKFEWNREVQTVVSDEDSVDITTTDGSCYNARYVIAADGSRSKVRKQIGATMEGSRDEGWYVVVDLTEDEDDPLPFERIFHYESPAAGGRNVLAVPFAGGWRLDLQLKPDDSPEKFGSEAGVKEWVAKVLGSKYADRITWISTYQFMQLVAHDFADEHRRVMLAGEAAHLFAPFGARGLNSGIPDAESAAWAVALGLSGTNRAVGRAAVEAFAGNRRSAATFNRNAAGEALAHLRPDEETLTKIRAAAEIAPHDQTASTWLEKAPYGPRGVPAAESIYRY